MTNTVYVKDWFINKIEVPSGWLVVGRKLDIMKETEKAYLGYIETVRCDGEYETIHKVWVPKSCTESEEEMLKHAEAMTIKFENGLKYNEMLVKFAKDNGIKGIRVGLRTATLEKKIREAGLEVPARAS